MSVYPKKRKGGATVYVYDFVQQGARFLSPTSYPTRKLAEIAERARRQKIAEGREDVRDDITLDEAAGLWWRDVGMHHRTAKDIERRIGTLLDDIGRTKKIVDIKTATVNEVVQKRRKVLVHGKPIKGATINRDVIETLRPILRYAAMIHELRLPTIDWKALTFKEADPLVREYQQHERDAWAARLAPPLRVMLYFLLKYGMRFGELFFPLDAVGYDAAGEPVLQLGAYKGRDGWRPSRKDGSFLRLPITHEEAELLLALVDQARAAGAETIWLEPGPGGRLLEIRYSQAIKRIRRAGHAAGIAPGRIVHGTRHHAGTAILRATDNLSLAKELLGHKKITTTQIYAHVTASDLKKGLDRVSRQIPDTLLLEQMKPQQKQDPE